MKVQQFWKWIFVSVFGIFIFYKIAILLSFNILYTDHDQCTLWYAAFEALQGHFYEPCFFGQSYNSNLEAYLAVPLLLFNVPAYVALPLVTLLMGILIFVLTSITLYRQGNVIGALVMLLVPMLMPVQYQLVMSLPRGFITGMFLVSLGHFFYANSEKKFRYFLFAFFMALGFWVNPNSVLMSAPLVVWCLFLNPIKESYLFLFSGALTGSLYKVFSTLFYETHPLYIYHSKPISAYDINTISDRFLNSGKFFFDYHWFVGLICLLALISFDWRKRRSETFMVIAFILVFIFSLGFERINDGLQTVFYSWGRMYLGAIWSVAFFAAFALDGLSKRLEGSKLFLLIPILLIAFIYFERYSKIDSLVKTETDIPDKGVIVSSITDLYQRNHSMIDACDKATVDLIVFPENCENCWMDTYSLPVISEGRVNTLNLADDRRSWRYFDEKKRNSRNFLSFGCLHISELDSDVIETSVCDSALVHECVILQVDTNVVDFFRGKVKPIRPGF